MIIEEFEYSNKKEEALFELPHRVKKIGKPKKSFNTLYVSDKVILKAEELAKRDTNVESGGFLLGKSFSKDGRYIICISDYVEAMHTDAAAASLTFTHKTWDALHEAVTEKNSDLKIIGWQHSHPGYGVFLSSYDLFIQNNFFNLPFQIAYVEEPVNNKRGFFEWNNGVVKEMPGYYVYNEE